ncbi:MAG: XdhC family protein [Acidobacteriota bacterium]|nr:XdhC family protein [Acidobacteriota bacterium]MDE3189363.1 XdhC family protein [Acidobacteriota bacterium]
MSDVVATVVATRSSAPRPIGSKLVVREDGGIEGSVSGGCVETDVVAAAQEVRESGIPRLVTYGISDDAAIGIGLPCGGEIDVWIEPMRDAGGDVVLTVIEGDDAGRRITDPDLERAARLRGRSHVIRLDGRTVFADVFGPPPRLFVYGAVDTAEALCAAAKLLGWRTIVADARPRFATPERLPSADEILAEWPEEALARVAPDASTAIVVLTHDDKFDLPAIRGALATDAFYIGWIGSRRNQARRRALLVDEGVSEAALERVSGPSGLDLGADAPPETAVSILGEILAVRSGRPGGRLREAEGRIHAQPVPADQK